MENKQNPIIIEAGSANDLKEEVSKAIDGQVFYIPSGTYNLDSPIFIKKTIALRALDAFSKPIISLKSDTNLSSPSLFVIQVPAMIEGLHLINPNGACIVGYRIENSIKQFAVTFHSKAKKPRSISLSLNDSRAISYTKTSLQSLGIGCGNLNQGQIPFSNLGIPTGSIHIHNCKIQAKTIGIYLKHVTGMIEHNVVSHCGNCGIFLEKCGYGKHPTRLMNNLCFSNHEAGILIRSSWAFLEGNICHSNSLFGIDIDQKSGNYLPIQLNKNVCYKNSDTGITIFDSWAILNENHCQDNLKYGIFVGKESGQNQPIQMKRNSCHGNGFTGIGVNSSWAVLQQNDCHANSSHGVEIDNKSGNDKPVQVNDNRCYGNSAAGIAVHSSWAALHNNHSHVNGLHGIAIMHESGREQPIALYENACHGNQEAGIAVHTSWAELVKNHCQANSLHGVSICFSSGQGWPIQLRKNLSLKNKSAGIAIHESWADLVGNHCYMNELHGISVEKQSGLKRPIQILQNKCSDNFEVGITIQNSWADLRGNDCQANSKHGISVAYESGRDKPIQLNQNVCHRNQEAGVIVISSWANLEKNFCQANLLHGISIEESSAELKQNFLYLNKEHGLYLREAIATLSSNLSLNNHKARIMANSSECDFADMVDLDNRDQIDELLKSFFSETSSREKIFNAPKIGNATYISSCGKRISIPSNTEINPEPFTRIYSRDFSAMWKFFNEKSPNYLPCIPPLNTSIPAEKVYLNFVNLVAMIEDYRDYENLYFHEEVRNLGKEKLHFLQQKVTTLREVKNLSNDDLIDLEQQLDAIDFVNGRSIQPDFHSVEKLFQLEEDIDQRYTECKVPNSKEFEEFKTAIQPNELLEIRHQDWENLFEWICFLADQCIANRALRGKIIVDLQSRSELPIEGRLAIFMALLGNSIPLEEDSLILSYHSLIQQILDIDKQVEPSAGFATHPWKKRLLTAARKLLFAHPQVFWRHAYYVDEALVLIHNQEKLSELGEDLSSEFIQEGIAATNRLKTDTDFLNQISLFSKTESLETALKYALLIFRTLQASGSPSQREVFFQHFTPHISGIIRRAQSENTSRLQKYWEFEGLEELISGWIVFELDESHNLEDIEQLQKKLWEILDLSEWLRHALDESDSDRPISPFWKKFARKRLFHRLPDSTRILYWLPGKAGWLVIRGQQMEYKAPGSDGLIAFQQAADRWLRYSPDTLKMDKRSFFGKRLHTEPDYQACKQLFEQILKPLTDNQLVADPDKIVIVVTNRLARGIPWNQMNRLIRLFFSPEDDPKIWELQKTDRWYHALSLRHLERIVETKPFSKPVVFSYLSPAFVGRILDKHQDMTSSQLQHALKREKNFWETFSGSPNLLSAWHILAKKLYPEKKGVEKKGVEINKRQTPITQLNVFLKSNSLHPLPDEGFVERLKSFTQHPKLGLCLGVEHRWADYVSESVTPLNWSEMEPFGEILKTWLARLHSTESSSTNVFSIKEIETDYLARWLELIQNGVVALKADWIGWKKRYLAHLQHQLSEHQGTGPFNIRLENRLERWKLSYLFKLTLQELQNLRFLKNRPCMFISHGKLALNQYEGRIEPLVGPTALHQSDKYQLSDLLKGQSMITSACTLGFIGALGVESLSGTVEELNKSGNDLSVLSLIETPLADPQGKGIHNESIAPAIFFQTLLKELSTGKTYLSEAFEIASEAAYAHATEKAVEHHHKASPCNFAFPMLCAIPSKRAWRIMRKRENQNDVHGD